MGVNFPVLHLDVIPENNWISPVLSVAGGNPTVSGYIYQTGIAVSRDGSVFWAPQIWYGTTNKWFKTIRAGSYNYIAWYLEIFGISDGVAEYMIYIYDTYSSYVHNYPYIKYVSAEINTSDTVFLVGYEYKNGYKIKFLQFGIEASTHIGDTDKWDIGNFEIGYLAGQWRYLPGYSVQHDQSWISYIGNNIFLYWRNKL